MTPEEPLSVEELWRAANPYPGADRARLTPKQIVLRESIMVEAASRRHRPARSWSAGIRRLAGPITAVAAIGAVLVVTAVSFGLLPARIAATPSPNGAWTDAATPEPTEAASGTPWPSATSTPTPSVVTGFDSALLAELCVTQVDSNMRNATPTPPRAEVYWDLARSAQTVSGRWFVEVPYFRSPSETNVGGDAAYKCSIGGTPEAPDFTVQAAGPPLTDQEWQDALNEVQYYQE